MILVNKHWPRWTAFCGAIVFLFPAAAMAGAGVEMPCEYPGGCVCIPNAKQFGYFPRKWREWPGERRPDKTFPQSIGTEVVPTPEGVEQVPLPKETTLPKPSPATKPDGDVITLPKEMVPPEEPSEEGIIPRDRKIKIDEGEPGVPLEPEAPAPMEPEPDSGLPGLPGQPEPSTPSKPSTTPGLPGLPGLPSENLKPAPQTQPRQGSLRRNDADNSGTSVAISRFPTGSTSVQPQGPFLDPQIRAPAFRDNVPASVTVQDGLASPSTYPATTHQVQEGPAPAPESACMVNQIGTVDHGGGRAHEAAYTATIAEQPQPQAWSGRGREFSGSQLDEIRQANYPPLGLAGYCPVELAEHEAWVAGDPRWTAVHQNRAYRMSGPAQHKRFLLNPHCFAPVLSGFDPVLALDESRHVPGQTEYCIVYEGRLYMFSSPASIARFRQNPDRYVVVTMKVTD